MNDPTFSAFSLDRTWTADDVPVLTAAVSLPTPVAMTNRMERRIHRYYQSQGRAFLRYCENTLFPLAQTAYQLALETSAPLPCYHAALTYTVTYQQYPFWSLYTQSREVTGQTLLRRWGDLWDLRTGYPAPLSAVLPRKSGWKRNLFAQIAAEIERQERIGIARYREDWRKRLRRAFNDRNFYLTDAGPVVFYPMHTLAPAIEGIPAFLIRSSENS